MKIPPPAVPNHGPKISKQESDRLTIELGLKYPSPTLKQRLEVKRDTMNVMIDAKLGQNFPQHRRDALWGHVKGFEQTAGLQILTSFITSPTDPFGKMAQKVVKRFAKELTFEELKQYFGYNDQEMNRLLS